MTVSISERNYRRITRILSVAVIVVPLVVIGVYLSTTFYRDVFFYADEFVVHEILQTGQIVPGAESRLADSPLMSENWGKIRSRKNLPILPILMATLTQVTGLSPNIWYIIFPGYVFLWLSYFVFFRCFLRSQRTAFVIAGAGSLAPAIPVIYSLNVTSLSNGLILLSVFCLAKSLSEHKVQVGWSISIGLFLTCLFFWYPPNFVLVGSLLAVVFVVSLLSDQQVKIELILPLVIVGWMFMQIFEIPLGTYIHYLTTSIVSLSNFQFTLPTGGQTSPVATVIKPNYYSLLALVSLFPLGVYGGLLAMRDSWKTSRFREHPYSLVAVCWGIAIFCVSVVYMGTGQSFLAGRPYQLSVPVMVVGVAIASRSRERFGQLAIIILLVTTVAGSFTLQATDPRAELQTYGPGSEDAGEWGARYLEGTYLSDVKAGAPLAGQGYLQVEHPDSIGNVSPLFYSRQREKFESYVEAKGAEGMVLTRDMRRTGIFASTLPHKPISERAYSIREKYYNKIYSSGDHNYIQFGSRA